MGKPPASASARAKTAETQANMRRAVVAMRVLSVAEWTAKTRKTQAMRMRWPLGRDRVPCRSQSASSSTSKPRPSAPPSTAMRRYSSWAALVPSKAASGEVTGSSTLPAPIPQPNQGEAWKAAS